MRCQDIERLILEARERELLREERLALEAHLESCSRCAAFHGFLRKIGISLQEPAAPELSAELAENVRLRCRAEFDSLSRAEAGQEVARGTAKIPWSVWAAVFVLTGLTLLFLIPGLEQFRQSQKLTPGIAVVLAVILQNAVMLFASPLLMRRGRLSQYRSGQPDQC
jgi:anti-sigma factor RsiW